MYIYAVVNYETQIVEYFMEVEEQITDDPNAIQVPAIDETMIQRKKWDADTQTWLDVAVSESETHNSLEYTHIDADGNKHWLDTYINDLAEDVEAVDTSGFAPADHTHNYLPLAGGTMTGDLYLPGMYFNQNGFGKGMIYGLAPDGETYVQNFQACSENGNCVVGYGNYDRKDGNTNIYGNGINVYSNVGTYIRDNTLHLTKTTDGSPTADNDVALIVGNRSGNHLAIDSNEIIAKASGTTPGDIYLVGDDIYFTSEHAGISMKPYFAKDDSFSFTGFVGAGFVTSSKTKVYFMFPLTRPLIGSPTITAAGSFILRQDGGYTHGSTSSTYVTPTNIEAALISGIGIRIVATFSDTTNAVNNAPIGISWNGSISFS